MSDWNPSSVKEKELKAALEGLSTSTQDVTLTKDDEEEKKFILQGKAYFSVKAYVMTGKEFPKNESGFDSLISRECFRILEQVDSDIYQETRTGLVAVGSSCSKFYDDELYRVVNAGSLTVTWSEKTLKLLKAGSKLSLYDRLMVLVDPKYQREADRDQEWINALNSANFTLKQLITDAENGKKEAEDIRTALMKFRDDTKNTVQPKVSELIRKYGTGPLNNPDVKEKTYLEFLNKDLADSTKRMEETLKKYNSTYGDWKTQVGISVGVGVAIGWIPVFGWTPLAFLAHSADELGKAWKVLEVEYKTLQQHNADEAKLITYISNLVHQFDGLLEKIDAAFNSVGVLAEMFERYSQSYAIIRDSLSSIQTSNDEADLNTRKSAIEYYLEETVSKIESLGQSAAGFVKAILNDDKEAFSKLN